MEVYARYERSFRRAVVLEPRADLVLHAHAKSRLAFWLSGARVEARLRTTRTAMPHTTSGSANLPRM